VLKQLIFSHSENQIAQISIYLQGNEETINVAKGKTMYTTEMKAKHAVTILVGLIFILALNTPLWANSLITKVAVENFHIDLAKGDQGAVDFELLEPCRVNLFITDVQGNIVQTLMDREELDVGQHLGVWDGMDVDDNAVADGIYFPIIQCISPRKGTFTHNPSATSWGAQVDAENFIYDGETQLLSFEVNTMVYGRLRVGLKEGGPVYKSLVPWRLWQPGTYDVEWDGKDAQGYSSIIGHEKLAYSFDAFALPANSFVATGAGDDRPLVPPAYRTFPIHPPSGEPPSFFALVADSMKAEPELAVDWPKSRKKGEVVQLKGKVLCTVSFADPTKRSATLEKGSELIVYVDGQYVTEKPLEGFPATIGFNSRDFSNGSHIVTINLLTTDDRAGISMHRVVIKN
jgi:hypothetical protein